MTAIGKKRVIGPLSPPPSAFTEEVEFVHPGGSAELRCRYERNGLMVDGGLRFDRVRAFKFRAEGHCTPWHVQDAYDTLVEVEQSAWVDELRSAEQSVPGDRWTIRHFLIYIDGAGAYEVAAEAVEWLPEDVAS